jgi:hypothetical protein
VVGTAGGILRRFVSRAEGSGQSNPAVLIPAIGRPQGIPFVRLYEVSRVNIPSHQRSPRRRVTTYVKSPV